MQFGAVKPWALAQFGFATLSVSFLPPVGGKKCSLRKKTLQHKYPFNASYGPIDLFSPNKTWRTWTEERALFPAG